MDCHNRLFNNFHNNKYKRSNIYIYKKLLDLRQLRGVFGLGIIGEGPENTRSNNIIFQ
jgi:hypothetical protein